MYTHQACGGQLAATAYISDCSFDVDLFATSMIHPPDILGWYRDETQVLSKCYADTDPVVMCRNTIREEDLYGCQRWIFVRGL
jgi:hypothetical protein